MKFRQVTTGAAVLTSAAASVPSSLCAAFAPTGTHVSRHVNRISESGYSTNIRYLFLASDSIQCGRSSRLVVNSAAPGTDTDTPSSSSLKVPPISDLGGTQNSGGYDVDEMTSLLLDQNTDNSSDTSGEDTPSALPAHVIKSAMPVCVAWSRTNSGTGAQIVERILYNVAREIISGDNEEATSLPWLNLCTVAIDAWATSCETGAAERAEALLGGMRDVSTKTNGATPPPSVISYNAVLKAYARQAAAGDKDAARNAERILNSMGEDGQADAVVTASEDNNVNGEEDECEVNSGLEPNQISYTTVIDAYAKIGGKDAAEGAERIFRRMERAYEDGCSEARPSVQSFNTVINAWITSGLVRGPMAAEEILKKMIYLHEKGVTDVEPTVVSFSSVMNGWAKSNRQGAAERALEIYELMEHMREKGSCKAKPNKYTYSILVDALVKGGMLQEAENVFNNIVKEYADDESLPKPNKIQATQIMNGWSKSGEGSAGMKTDVLLTTLERLYDKYQDKSIRPSVVSYCAAINAWAKSKAFGKARRARETLDRMIDAYKAGNEDARPNVSAFTAVLNACAFTQGDTVEKMEALQIATKTYKELYASDYGDPNQFTFATFLRVCSNIIPPGPQRVSSMDSVLQQAIRQGKVDDLVLRVLQSSVSTEELETMLPCKIGGKKTITTIDLPNEWSSNLEASSVQSAKKANSKRRSRSSKRR